MIRQLELGTVWYARVNKKRPLGPKRPEGLLTHVMSRCEPDQKTLEAGASRHRTPHLTELPLPFIVQRAAMVQLILFITPITDS